MATVFDVARWFLKKEAMTHKKLQKLCYYAQAWSCALLEQPILTEEFEAWVHGPVCRSLWNQYNRYGFDLIPAVSDAPAFPSVQLELLEDVWETYGGLTSNALEALTHSEPPWQKARIGLEPNELSTRTIDREDMKNYYRSIYIGGTE